MPCPHNEITIVQRSQRQSAVAAAAYQSGEKLFCEYDQQVKHYPEKRGIVHNEILLPPNAPQEYADRNTLWNAAEAVEKQWNSQLARRWVLTIPREIPPDQYAVLVREFCQKQFVSKGMIADFAIHDPHPPGHNPHAHVMLTMRAMDEHGKWLPKSRKVYDLDENGERIKLPSGRWKSHKEDTVDWNDQKYCEIWRHEWEVIQNRYLEANDRPERVDLRSYARQGLDIIPTVHEGAAVRQMEKRGIQTNIGNLNRDIRAANRLMKSIRQLIQNLKGWITELGEKRKELLAQKAAEEATLLPNLLMKYMEIRKEERKDWTRAGQNRGTSQDLKAVSEALSYLRQKGLSTVEDLEAFLEASGKSAADYRNQMKPKEARRKVIDGILASRTDCKECKPVYEKYQKIFFKKTKEKFKQEHPEVARYEKAAAYLAKHPDDKDSTQKGSLNLFNHRTNVDIDNRIVCYDIKELGKQMKKLGMLVIQDQVWGRVTANRTAGKSTRYYADEFHLLLKEEQTAAYSVEIWKRFRKWGGIPTGLTQNVKDLLSSREVENIFENSDMIIMLNQAAGDRQILAKQLNISPHQLSYVTHSGEGEGLLFFGNVILPFVDRFPTDLELYRIMTTKLGEVSEGAQK